MAEGKQLITDSAIGLTTRSKRRDLIELAVAYGLILVVIWTPRPWQRFFWMLAVATVAIITWISFDGLKAMGLRRENFFRSLWIVGAALAASAVAVTLALRLHTLQEQDSFFAYVRTYWGYAIWTFVQEFLLQCFFLSRLRRLLPNAGLAALAAASIFALAHLPSPILTTVTLVWGFAACLLFLRYRNLYPLAMAHAILGITVAITVPGPVDHNMRVGLGYLTYGHRAHRAAHPSLQP
jgi:hypothetical protein